MEGEDLVEPDKFFNLANGVIPAFLGAEIKTSFEEMRGVETNTEAARIFDALKNFAKMFDAVAEATSLAGSVFEGDADGGDFCDRENFVEARNNVFNSGFVAGAEVRTRMHHEKWKTERGGEIDFLDERFDGVIAIGRRRGAEIDEVTGVAENGVEFSGGELVGVEGEFLRFVWASEPLHVVFDEKLDDIAADLDAAFEGFVRSA